MPELPSSDPRQFIQGAPVLHVKDVMGTAAFYRDVLGFGTLAMKHMPSSGETTQPFTSSKTMQLQGAYTCFNG